MKIIIQIRTRNLILKELSSRNIATIARSKHYTEKRSKALIKSFFSFYREKYVKIN
jgi:hypothetical protein